MPIPFKRGDIRALMEAAARQRPKDDDIATAFMLPAEARKYRAMSEAEKDAYWNKPLSAEARKIIDDARERMIDVMPNVVP